MSNKKTRIVGLFKVNQLVHGEGYDDARLSARQTDTQDAARIAKKTPHFDPESGAYGNLQIIVSHPEARGLLKLGATYLLTLEDPPETASEEKERDVAAKRSEKKS